MKHLLNDLSSDEKNRIREQYEGGMSVDNSKFKKLLESKLGDVKLLVMEQPTKMKTGESLNDDELFKMACTTWSRYTSEDKKMALNWTKKLIGTGYPYDMNVVCKSDAKSSIGSNTDRTILKGIIELNWMR